MSCIIVPNQSKSKSLIQFCRVVFDMNPNGKTVFYFANRKVKLVLEDFGGDESFDEVHISCLEVHKAARGTGLASIAMKALTEGADYHQVFLSLTPGAYGEDDRGLTQRQLEAFYRRHGFRAERGSVKYEQHTGKFITGMRRKPQ